MYGQYEQKGRNFRMKKFISVITALVLVLTLFTACQGKENKEDATGNTLSFSKANSIEEMQKLDGETVEIIGYMSTLSPINGEFMYLMNLPYQNCPFCVPNTTQLSNTMAVYAPEGKSFEFTDRAIKVTGTMEFGDYTDEFGYEYNYRITDASFTEVDTSEMSEKMKLWQSLAATDVISDVYAMYEYVNFLCFWGVYTAEFDSGEDYLYPTDALAFIQTEDAQFNYGYKDGYFEDMISTINEVDETRFADLTDNILKAQALAEKALKALENGEYENVDEYSGRFNDGRKQYRMNAEEEFDKEMSEIYQEFASWLAQWEM